MTDALILAEIAQDAYSNTPANGLPQGFEAASLPGVSLHAGLFTSGADAASVSTGTLDGQQVLVVAFRGSDDSTDWKSDLRNIDTSYAGFLPLVSAIEHYAAAGGRVVLTGHSLGGAMAQIFMAEHPGDDHYRAVTFGSPGALPEAKVFAAEADTRITNYAVSDDPMVFLGEHRAEVARYAIHHLAYGLALAAEVALTSGLSFAAVVASEAYMTTDYVNNGATVALPGSGHALTVSNVIAANPGEHDPSTYVHLVGGAGVAQPHLWG